MPSTSNIVREEETETRMVSLASGIASTNVDAGEGGRDVVNSWNLCMCVGVCHSLRSRYVMSLSLRSRYVMSLSRRSR